MQRLFSLFLLLLLTLSAVVGLQVLVLAPPSPNLPAPVAVSTRSQPMPALAKIERQRLLNHLEVLAVERYSTNQRQQARDYIQEQLSQWGWQVREHRFEGGVNLVAEQPGTNPRAGILLVGGHYDTVAGSPGADDNASAVVTLLELARIFANQSSPRSLRLVFFDLEEQGLLGSFAYASQPSHRENLAGVIVLEMLGYRCQTVGCQKIPANLPVQPPTDKGDFIAIVGDTEHLPLLQRFSQVNPQANPPLLPLAVPFQGALTPDLLRSDHAPFWQQGIGAVMVTDTANFRNPHYHKPTDTNSTIDLEFLTNTAQLVATATTSLLQDTRPLTSAS